VRAVAVLLVLAAVPAGLWLAGYLPPPSPPGEPARAAPDPRSAEQDWRERVNAICAWERKRVRGLTEAYRRVATPADALLAFDSAIRLGSKSLAIFRDLDPPFAFQREAREFQRLLQREQAALVALREALRKGNARAFARNAQKIVRAEERKRAIFADLGVRDCLPRAPEVPPEPERSTV
jgi:hypothetical protein